ncbi:Usherin [Liparis tanakae]|uniref:Usherin n=1 Tax=Liparis tanakae TaxID=230148 RepID=A0A4Z2HNJ7_9TELE|nr:Usherin [Liparis tanakae]
MKKRVPECHSFMENVDMPVTGQQIRRRAAAWSEFGEAGCVGADARARGLEEVKRRGRDREIVEVYSGVLPDLHAQSECRCPPSHPKVHPLVERYCIANGVEDTTSDRVLRLNLNAHPLSYINDQDMGTTWLSKIMTTQDPHEGLTLTVDLVNGQYQFTFETQRSIEALPPACAVTSSFILVLSTEHCRETGGQREGEILMDLGVVDTGPVFYVILQFSGLLPESLLIQRRRLDLPEPESGRSAEPPWLDWQYMAMNCSVFEMPNNGPLPRPDSVNCLQLPSSPLSGGSVIFSLLTPEPNLRPGYSDFYNTPALQEMVHASQVRVHLSGLSHLVAAGANQRHRYYAINEITVSGRCECHGHADHCDTRVTPYRCLCLPESHAEGNNSEALFAVNLTFWTAVSASRVMLTTVGAAGLGPRQSRRDIAPKEALVADETEGDDCQRCAPLYNDKPFRSGDQLQPMNCRSCQCHGHAPTCHYDIRADDQPDEHYRGGGGVCDNCTHNTTGQNCELCISGFFELEGSDPTSESFCQPCNCNTAGTVSSSAQCAQVHTNMVMTTKTHAGGQCRCKAAVTGQRCVDCLPGWFGLQASNPNGCTRCNCSDIGIISTSTGVAGCDRDTGRCQCKPHVTGLPCDRCEFGYWNLSHPDGCVPCDCDPLGSLSPFCEPEGGRCECKPGEHVEGRDCDSCRHGYHILEQRNSLGCLPCACDAHGTAPEGVCDAWTGQCPCRDGVEGAQCTNCAHNYYNRSSHTQTGSSQGCVPCICELRGTVAGSACDSSTGQCVCVPTRSGKDCSSCRPDQSVCAECDCHPMGASQRGCESRTGRCVCAHPSVGGRRCDQCPETFFGFNPGVGRCQPCACDPMGSVDGSCHPDSGVCVCKLLVTGDKCDTCQPGASHFDPESHFGCSKAPSQQPAPGGVALSFSSIRLSWHPPDSPNSNRLNYTLVRDGQSVHSLQSHYPYTPESFEDAVLFPFTNYSYWLVTANVAGETISASASYQTLGAPPEVEQLHLNLVGRPGPTTASFDWSTPRNDTGPVERFALSSVEWSGAEPVSHYTGLSTEAVASGLKPFTQYTVTLEPRPPHNTNHRPESPLQDLIHCTLPGSPPVSQMRVFLSAGWLDPSVSPEVQLSNRSSVPPPESSATVGELQAFSTYQMRVVSVNIAGSATSGWAAARTMEGVPELMAPPEVSAASSTSLNVSWRATEGHGVIARGPVTEFRVNLLNEQTNNPYAPPVISQGLQPYRVYNFTMTLCTKTGCISSPPGAGRTLPAAPTGLSPPRFHPVNETSIQIHWDPPARLNGPEPLYQYWVHLKTTDDVTMQSRTLLYGVTMQQNASSLDPGRIFAHSCVVVYDYELLC